MAQTKEERKAYLKAYYEANKEQAKARYETNKEKRLAYSKTRYEADKEKAKAYQKAHYEANKEKALAYQKAYRKANIEKVYAFNAQYRARKLNQTPEMNIAEQVEIEYIYMYNQIMPRDWEVDHIDPLDNGGLHHPSNLQVLSEHDNRSKSSKVISSNV